VTVDIVTARACVRFLDSSGAALAGRDVYLRLDRPDQPWPFRKVHTDAQGRVDLTLATGPYRFALASDAPGTSVQWSATGPASLDIGL
jgi:hypothetical protein